MEKIIDRVIKYADAKDLSLREFSLKIGASAGYLSSIKRNGSNVGGDHIENIAHIFEDLNPSWLMTGKGEMLKQVPEQVAEEPQGYPNDSIALVRSDIQNLSNALAQPLERLSNGMFKLLLDQQKILRVAEDLNLERLNKIGDKLEELLKQ